MRFVLIVPFLIKSLFSFCQEDSVQAFSRPEITERHLFEPLKAIESEISFTYNDFLGAGNIWPPFALIGGHISEKTEGRFAFNYEPQSNRYVLFNGQNNLTNLCLGEMTNLVETDNWMPDVFMVNNVFYPYRKFISPDIKYLNLETALFFQNIINRRLTVNYSTSYIYANYYLQSSIGYSFCVNYFINPAACLFAEQFGFYHLKDKIFEAGWDGGIMYSLKKSQLDLCYARNYYAGINLGFFSITYSRNLQYKTTRKR